MTPKSKLIALFEAFDKAARAYGNVSLTVPYGNAYRERKAELLAYLEQMEQDVWRMDRIEEARELPWMQVWQSVRGAIDERYQEKGT